MILADSSVGIFGGSNHGQLHTPVYTPNLFKEGVWTKLAVQSEKRPHHSGALYLPIGEVMSLSGWPGGYPASQLDADFQKFEPHYIACGAPRPQWSSLQPWSDVISVTHGSTIPVNTPWFTVPAGVTIQKVVLMRPGSLTHHCDLDQRYWETPALPPDGEELPPYPQQSVRFLPPANLSVTPRGRYMLFLLTADGIPSVARWVDLT